MNPNPGGSSPNRGRGAGRSRNLNHPGAFASSAMSGQGQGQQGGGLRSRSANEANGGGCGYDAGGGIGDHDHDGGGRLKDGRRKDPEPDTANFRLDDYRWHGNGGRRKRGLGIGLGLGPELSGGGAIGGIGVVGHPGWNEREARMEPPAPPGGGGGNLRPVPTSRPGAMDGLGRGGGGSGGVGEFPHGEDGDGGGGGGGGGGGNRHHAVAGRAGGAGAGAPAGRRSGEQPARVQEYKDEVVDKWKALSVAAFDVLDTVRAASSNDNEDRDFLKAIVREAARRGVLDGTPYIASLADLLRGEDEVQEQQQPAEDLGGVGNGAAASAAAAAQERVCAVVKSFNFKELKTKEELVEWLEKHEDDLLNCQIVGTDQDADPAGLAKTNANAMAILEMLRESNICLCKPFAEMYYNIHRDLKKILLLSDSRTNPVTILDRKKRSEHGRTCRGNWELHKDYREHGLRTSQIPEVLGSPFLRLRATLGILTPGFREASISGPEAADILASELKRQNKSDNDL